MAETLAFYRDFGIGDVGDRRFTTSDGAQQLHLVPFPLRRLITLSLGADDVDDIPRIASSLAAPGFAALTTPLSVLAGHWGRPKRTFIEWGDKILPRGARGGQASVRC